MKEAIRLRPDLIEAHYSLSIAYKKLGRQPEAATEVDLVRRLREQNPQAEQELTGIRQILLPAGTHR